MTDHQHKKAIFPTVSTITLFILSLAIFLFSCNSTKHFHTTFINPEQFEPVDTARFNAAVEMILKDFEPDSTRR